MKKQIKIPDDLDFSHLRLVQEPNGNVSFSLAVIERICAANNLPTELFFDAPEDNVSELIVNWYAMHRRAGGDLDSVAENLIAEVRIEDAMGQPVSLKPGRA